MVLVLLVADLVFISRKFGLLFLSPFSDFTVGECGFRGLAFGFLLVCVVLLRDASSDQ